MVENNINPSGNMYDAFMKIIKSITIKYSYKAQKYETMESKMIADGYLDAKNKKDTFFTYRDYTDKEFFDSGFYDMDIIQDARVNNTWKEIPIKYRESILELRRKREIDTFEEKNNYYRMLNGYPDVEDEEYYYIPSSIANEYDINPNVPIHKIQDYYNNIEDEHGDYLISIIEGYGYIEELIEKHPEKKYLNYIGSNRIYLSISRKAKNFQIIQIRNPDVKQSILDAFIRVYEQCREYFVKTIYISNYSKFIDYYDNFIALCIMVMTMQQIAVKQISLGIKRNYFDIFAIKTLYEAYDIPYNLNIDEDTQALIVQNLNLLIQNKATDKVLYNISDLLGFTNINIYKYYLTRDHKMDIYNVPIFKYTERFNSDTGEMETVPDYKAMYDLYFQKYELKNKDFTKSFKDKSNRVEYEEVVQDDPFWWEDQNIYERLWETEYNFVESKYLSLGISYSMTEIMFENVIFLKLMLQEEDKFRGLQIKLPKIIENANIPILDVIILMLCLTSSKHNLYGEVISIPTQVISVMDYIENTERDGNHNDTFKFNYNYFFNPDEYEDKEKIDEMKDDLINHMNNLNKDPLLVNNVSFNFDYFSTKNKDREKNIQTIKNILGEEDYEKFEYYVDKVSNVKNKNNSERIQSLNDMFKSIKGLYRLILFYMTKTDDMKIYNTLKTIYDSLFVAKEMSDLFTITNDITNEETGETESFKRTAWTYFEFLYYRNPKLYNAIYKFDIKEEYNKYLSKNKLNKNSFSLYEFKKKVAKGEIFLDFGQLKIGEDNSAKDEKLYSYITHVISRLEMIIEDLKFMYLMIDTSTPLEKLLLELVRFFKSYTVDIISLDTLFIDDFKLENIIKLFDIIHYINKTIGVPDTLRLSYSDSINKVISVLNANEDLKLNDKLKYNVQLVIDELYGNTNSVRLEDLIYISKNLLEKDESLLKITDSINHYSVTNVSKDSMKITDKVFKLWYSD